MINFSVKRFVSIGLIFCIGSFVEAGEELLDIPANSKWSVFHDKRNKFTTQEVIKVQGVARLEVAQDIAQKESVKNLDVVPSKLSQNPFDYAFFYKKGFVLPGDSTQEYNFAVHSDDGVSVFIKEVKKGEDSRFVFPAADELPVISTFNKGQPFIDLSRSFNVASVKLKGGHTYNIYIFYSNTIWLGEGSDYDGLSCFMYKAETPNPVRIQKLAFTNAEILNTDDNKVTYSAEKNHWIDDDVDGKPDVENENSYPRDKVKSYPCSYAANSVVNVKTTFKISDTSIKKVWIRGKSGSEDSPLIFDPEEITVSNSQAIFVQSSDSFKKIGNNLPTGQKTTLVGKVRCYITENRGKPWKLNDPLKLKWEFALVEPGSKTPPADAKWRPAGLSEHTIYVTLSSPSRKMNDRQETLFNLSCRNGNNKTTHDEIFYATWDDIDDRQVLRMDGMTMKYWMPYVDTCPNTTNGMLAEKTGNGTCGAWAELLFKTMKVHNEPTIRVMHIVPDKTQLPNGVGGFLISKWKFGESIHSGGNFTANSSKAADDEQNVATGQKTKLGNNNKTNTYIFPGKNHTLDSAIIPDDDKIDGGITVFSEPDWPHTVYEYKLGSLSRGDKLGSCGGSDTQPPAQGINKYPPPEFANHAIVSYLNGLWDPSYGTSFSDIDKNKKIDEIDVENSIIDGFVKGTGQRILVRKNDVLKKEISMTIYKLLDY